MADENVLDYLREQFARVHARFDGIERTLAEHTVRLARLEREVANLHVDWADLSARLDRFERRLERIEQRLRLIEG